MHLSSRIKLMSTCGLLFAMVISLTLFGSTRGISHASGTLPQTSTQIGVTSATTTSSCGSWQIVPIRQPSGLDFDELNGVVALSTSNVWAVGYANGALIEHWDGTQWSIVSHLVGGSLSAVTALSANNIWAVGETFNSNALIEHWNGAQWSIVPIANLGSWTSLFAVTALSANNIWAVGETVNSSTISFDAVIAHWDGIQWSIVPSPVVGDALYAVTALSANNIWAVGDGALIEHWNGAQWSIIPNSGGILSGVTALSANNIWAVGGDNGALIEHWNGKQWSVVVSSQAVISYLFAVTALSANNIWAVGWRGAATGNFEPLIEHWNGSSWSIVRSAKNGTGSVFLAVAQIPRTSKLWAVGLHYKDNNNYANLFTEFSC